MRDLSDSSQRELGNVVRCLDETGAHFPFRKQKSYRIPNMHFMREPMVCPILAYDDCSCCLFMLGLRGVRLRVLWR
jgi:hypothetical protein